MKRLQGTQGVRDAHEELLVLCYIPTYMFPLSTGSLERVLWACRGLPVARYLARHCRVKCKARSLWQPRLEWIRTFHCQFLRRYSFAVVRPCLPLPGHVNQTHREQHRDKAAAPRGCHNIRMPWHHSVTAYDRNLRTVVSTVHCHAATQFKHGRR